MSERITNVEIFSIGTWNGYDIEPKDLTDIVRNFSALGSAGRLPLKLGHDDAQPVSGAPAVGWIDAVRVAPGGKLVADVEVVSDVVMKALRKGLYRHVSVELVKNPEVNGHTYEGYALDALAILGAEAPAVTNLEGLAKLAASRAQAAIAMGRRMTFSRPLPTPPAVEEDQAAEIARLRAELTATREAHASTIEAQRVEFARQRAHEAASAHQREVLGLLEKAVRERRMLPAHREKLIQMKKLRDPTAALQFTREEAELYCDSHDQAPSIALLFSNQARSSKPGQQGPTDPPHETLLAQARAIFARGEAADIFDALTRATIAQPHLMQSVLEHDLTG